MEFNKSNVYTTITPGALNLVGKSCYVSDTIDSLITIVSNDVNAGLKTIDAIEKSAFVDSTVKSRWQFAYPIEDCGNNDITDTSDESIIKLPKTHKNEKSLLTFFKTLLKIMLTCLSITMSITIPIATYALLTKNTHIITTTLAVCSLVTIGIIVCYVAVKGMVWSLESIWGKV